MGPAFGVWNNVKSTVLAPFQILPYQRLAVEVATAAVKPPVFAEADLRVQDSLLRNVSAGGALRGDFQHEIGRLANLPHKISVAVIHGREPLGGHAQGHMQIRRYESPGIALLVVDERVAAHLYVRAIPEVLAHRAHDFGEIGFLVTSVGQGFVIRVRVVYIVGKTPAQGVCVSRQFGTHVKPRNRGRRTELNYDATITRRPRRPRPGLRWTRGPRMRNSAAWAAPGCR